MIWIHVIQNVLIFLIEILFQVLLFQYLVYLDFEYVMKDFQDNKVANYYHFEEVIMDHQHHEEQVIEVQYIEILMDYKDVLVQSNENTCVNLICGKIH